MSGEHTTRRPGGKPWGILLLVAVSLGGVAHRRQAQAVYSSAQHFVGYYRALNHGVGLFERLALSLVLTSTDSSERDSGCPGSIGRS